MSSKYALIIGNTDYIDPGLAQLTAPGQDAEDFARVLKDKDICAFDDVKVLFNELSSTAIEKIDEFFDQKKSDDLLVLYFSGHGVRDEFGSLYLAFKNTIRSRLRSTSIEDYYIRKAMDQSRSRRQVLILDCCNSGAFTQGAKAEVGGTMGLTQAFQGNGRFVLTASDATQFAWEGEKVIGETQNSLFTHFLLKGLGGEADNDGDGKITVDELYDYAYEQISKVTPKQTPTKSASKVEGDIVLRQITRIEDIKPVSLPDDLISEIEDIRPLVREGAVQRLIKILNGKNIGLQRSALEALEKIVADENTTRRVAQLATQALETYHLVEQKAEEERIAKAKAEAELKASEEADRIAAQKAEEERVAAEKAEAKRKASAKSKAEAERKAKEKEERNATQKVETDGSGRQKAEKEQTETIQADADRKAKEVAIPLSSPRVNMNTGTVPAASQKKPVSIGLVLGAVAVVLVCVIIGFGLYAGLIGFPPAATQAPIVTKPPATEAATQQSDIQPESSRLLVGIVLPTKDEPRWVQDDTRFKDLFSKAGYDVPILFSQGDSAKEKANVEALISQGIKVLIICPQDGYAAAATADEAHAAGVKVISYDRLILGTSSVDYYVTFDSVSVGAAQARYLVDHVTGKNNPLYLYAGAASDNNAFLFFQGAWDVLQPKIADGTFLIKNSSEAMGLQDKAELTRDEQAKIIGQITTNWDFNTAKSLAESNLTAASAADKGNVFILAPNDGTARAIADAFAVDKDVISYVVTGQDAEEASVQYIIDGKQSMTVLKDVRILVADATSAAITFSEGGAPPQTVTYNNGNLNVPAKPSEVISVDRSNVIAAIIDSGYWPASDFTGLP